MAFLVIGKDRKLHVFRSVPIYDDDEAFCGQTNGQMAGGAVRKEDCRTVMREQGIVPCEGCSKAIAGKAVDQVLEEKGS